MPLAEDQHPVGGLGPGREHECAAGTHAQGVWPSATLMSSASPNLPP
jgi:hypothetical protein